MPSAFEYDEDGQTPLNNDEIQGLIPDYITTRGELNAAEQRNILDAEAHVFRRLPSGDSLTEDYILEIHKRMFDKVWRWAGTLRRTDKNIGGPWTDVPAEFRSLVGDLNYWLTRGTYKPDELAIRFHHRVVSIHLFPNGNGRHARMMSDIIAVKLGRPRFTWGASIPSAEDARKQYIESLRQADAHDIEPLLKISRA